MEITVFVTALGAAIVGVVEVAKRTGLNERWAPLLALALGIGGAIGARSQGAIIPTVDGFVLILAGIVAGLTASGAYSGARASTGR